MKVWKYALGWLAFAGLLLLAGSGVYDAAGGIRASARYLQWYGEHYGAMPVSLVISAYMLGVFRGTAALACAAAGAAGIARGRLRLRYFLALGLWISWGRISHTNRDEANSAAAVLATLQPYCPGGAPAESATAEVGSAESGE